MTIQSKESPITVDHESSKTVSTANSSMFKQDSNDSSRRRLLKRVWKAIIVGDLQHLKSL